MEGFEEALDRWFKACQSLLDDDMAKNSPTLPRETLSMERGRRIHSHRPQHHESEHSMGVHRHNEWRRDEGAFVEGSGEDREGQRHGLVEWHEPNDSLWAGIS